MVKKCHNVLLNNDDSKFQSILKKMAEKMVPKHYILLKKKENGEKVFEVLLYVCMYVCVYIYIYI